MKKIEDAIHTLNFRNREERLLVAFMFTFNWLKEYQVRLFKPFGLTLQQYNILRILRGSGNGPLNQKEVKRRMLDKMSDVSRLIKRMEKKKLIISTINDSDRRNMDIVLTQEGLNLLERIDAALPVLDKVFKDFKEGDMKNFEDLLAKMRSTKFPKPI